MPMYDYQCPKCGARDEAVRAIADRENGPECSECGVKCEHRVSAANGQVYRHKNKARRDAKASNLSEI